MPVPLATVFGGGGLFGIAYLLGVGEALIDSGVPLGEAPSLGTSAGSWAAAAFGLGVRWEEAIARFGEDIPRRPDPRRGRLRVSAATIFGEQRAPLMRAAVCSVPRLRRVVLSGVDTPVADLIAASSAVPGLVSPHRVNGHWYVDGGVRSLVSADRGDDAEHLLVVAPIAGPMLGPAGRFAERRLNQEMEIWKRMHPLSQLSMIRPNRAIADLARWPGHLFDNDRARRCYTLAYAQGAGILERWNAGPLGRTCGA